MNNIRSPPKKQNPPTKMCRWATDEDTLAVW